jgi:hypothetical protein
MHLFKDLHLVDLEPTKLIPTWRNGRQGEEGVYKRLDCFLITKSIVHGN